MDATKMSFDDAAFDLVVEKGTLDALYTGASHLVAPAVDEVWRVLRPGGRFWARPRGGPSRTSLTANEVEGT